jgi:hypothetical protein
MRAVKSFRTLCLGLIAPLVVLVGLAPAPAAASTLRPAWAPIAVAGPTNLPPGGEGTIAVFAQDIGGAASSGSLLDKVVVTDELPPGLTTAGKATGEGWDCLPEAAGQSIVTCTSSKVVDPGLASRAIEIPVKVGPTPGPVLNKVTASGGGAATMKTYEAAITLSSTPAKPGVQAFTAATVDADGTANRQAGSHPYASIAAVFANTVLTADGKKIIPAGDPKTIEVAIPPGFLGNPTATLRCTEGLEDVDCPIDTQVGLAQPLATAFGHTASAAAIHNVEAPVGYPGKVTFSVAGVFQVNAVGSLRSDKDYGLSLISPNTAQIEPVYGAFVALWGAPADHSHDAQRCVIVETQVGCGPSDAEDKAFVTQPSDCSLQAVQPPVTTLSFDSWLTPGQFERIDFPVPSVSGCDQLHLVAGFGFQPEKKTAATPSAFSIDLNLPQEGLTNPELLAAPPLRTSEIRLPKGVTLNPSAVDGLATCSEAQIGRLYPEAPDTLFPEPNKFHFDKEPNHCPDGSKVGTVEVQTPLLDHPLHGSLYLATERENPFDSLLAVYLVVEDPGTGIVVKLPGEMQADPVTGQLSAVFDDTPQVPFEEVKLSIKGGERAPLATPDTCDTATTTGIFTPWSAPESGLPTETTDSFEVSGGPGGGPCAPNKAARPFAPAISAGTGNAADTYSPLEFKVTRKDGEQELKGLQITLPPGLIGKIAGIGTCSDTQIIAAADLHRTGKAEQANPSCPASSQLGTVTVGAGIGSAPFYVNGKAYLAGPYKGAPLSVVTIIPAIAGPFDLGVVVTRAATYLDPTSARLTAVTDPLPDILQGIPVALRSVKVDLDRPDFTLTPTSCNKMAIAAKLTGANNTSFNASVPFQVGGCKNLAFKPKLSAKLRGGTARNAHPALKTVLSYPAGLGYANIASTQVAFPHSEFLDQSHIDTVCTRVQFAAKACPAGSIYGHVEAKSPLLDEPLTGAVYLRSSEHQLPDLVFALKGPQSLPIEAEAAGRIDSIHGGVRATFESIPDVPLSKVVITMKGGNKGLFVNSRNLCKGRKARMAVHFVGQNGKRADASPVLGNDCGRKHHKKRSKS